jgi:hypothetical protein
MQKTIIFILLAAFFSCVSGCSTIELNAGASGYIENADDEVSAITMRDLGISGDIEINYFVGIGLYTSFMFPQKINTTVAGKSVTVGNSDFDSIVGFDMLLGPVFTVYKTRRSRLFIAAGFHTQALAWEGLSGYVTDGYYLYPAKQDTTIVWYGFGANIAAQSELSDGIYLTGRIQLTSDPYVERDTTYNISGLSYGITETYSGHTTYIGITPSIGLGYRF